MCTTETWLRPEVSTAELFPDTYNVYRSDRKFEAVGASRGGGVLVGVSNRFISEKLDLTDFCNSIAPSIDIVCCKITFKFQLLYIFVLYIPPTIAFENFEHFFDQFTNLVSVFAHLIFI